MMPFSPLLRHPITVCVIVATSMAAFVTGPARAEGDTRQVVELPELMQRHMLANMRDHLESLNEILVALSTNNFDQAARIAETRLGMSSLDAHGAEVMGRFMPESMRALGLRMHRAASNFAHEAQEASVDGAHERSLVALAEVTRYCVACHASFRLR